MQRSRFAWLALAMAFLAGEVAAEKVLRVGITAALTDFDAQKVRDAVTAKALNNVYDQLVAIASGSTRLEPALATSWTNAKRFSEWVFHIRKDVAFSDGSKATPSEIARSIRAVESIAERGQIEADDAAGTIVFRLTHPDAEFPSLLAQNYAGISLRKGGKVFGTGPFVIAPESTPTRLVLTRHAGYWGAPAKLDQVVFVTYKPERGSYERLLQALQKGEVDLTDALPIGEVPKLAGSRDLISRSVVGRSVGMLAMNNEKKPFDDVRVRRAIAHAIDRDALVRTFYPAGTGVARSPVPPTILRADADPYRYDVAKAKTLLAAAGLEKGFETSILQTWTARPYAADPQGMVQRMVKDLAAIGIIAKVVVPKDADDFFARLGSGQFELALQGWIADTGSAADFLESNLASSMIGTCPACNNMSRFRNAKLDERVREARATKSADALAAVLADFNREIPFVPIVFGPESAAWNRRVRGFEVSPTPTMYLRAVDLE